jgi:hypothetical protein
MTQALPSNRSRDQEILALNQTVLESVVDGDWSTYAGLCSEDLSCFEAETNGTLAEGLAFHRYYFELPEKKTGQPAPIQVSMARPHLRWLGNDVVVVSFTRLTQRISDGAPVTSSSCETRIWARREGAWKQVHVHRS